MAPKSKKRKSTAVKKGIKQDKNKEWLPGRIAFSLMGFLMALVFVYILAAKMLMVFCIK